MDAFLGEIRVFPYNFVPKGWAACNGQQLLVNQNTALFAIIGTIYGGDGTENFAVPNLQGAVPMHPGKTEIKTHVLGEQGGTATVTLTQATMPLHNHRLMASVENATQGTPNASVVLATSQGGSLYQNVTNSNLTMLNLSALPPAGGDGAHNNMMPYLTLNFCICLDGIFPPRPPN